MQATWISSGDLNGRITAGQFLSSSLRSMERVKNGNYPTCPISQIGKVRGGKRLPPNSRYVTDGIPYVRSTDIRDLRVDFSQVVKISLEHQKIIANYPLEYQDVVIGIAGTIGTIGIVDENVGPCHFNENLARITGIQISPAYLAIYLDSRLGQAFIDYLKGGAVQPKLSLININRIQVPLPPREVQDRIAGVMHAASVAWREKLVEAQRLTANMGDELLTLLGVNVALVHSEKKFTVGISELSPKWCVENNNLRGLKQALQSSHYSVVTVDELGDFITTRYGPTGQFRYIEIGDIDTDTGTIILGQLAGYDPTTAPNNAQRQVKKGDILISTRRPTRGAISTVPTELDGEVATLFFSIIRLKDNSVALPEYICAFLRTPISQLQIRAAITETTYPVISDSDVGRLLLPLPPIEIQTKIVEEITRRRAEAKRLRVEAEQVVTQAKAKVERMILGEETA